MATSTQAKVLPQPPMVGMARRRRTGLRLVVSLYRRDMLGMAGLVLLVALAVAIAVAGVWVATGAHWGWTKTSVEKKIVDEVTGIEGRSYEKRFVAGVDFLGAGLLLLLVLGTSASGTPKPRRDEDDRLRLRFS